MSVGSGYGAQCGYDGRAYLTWYLDRGDDTIRQLLETSPACSSLSGGVVAAGR